PVAVPGSTGGENETQLAGSLFWNNRLIITKRNRYSTGGYNALNVGTSSITGFSSMLQFQGQDGHFIGYMGVIPPEWRSSFGGPCFIGNSAMSIISVCSQGPTFYVFNPDTVGVTSPVPNLGTCMAYPYPQYLANPNSANNLFTRADFTGGMIFPDGTRSVLYVHRHGYGSPTYKQADGCWGGTGEGAAPYRRQVTAFDANDLLAAKRGTISPSSIQP